MIRKILFHTAIISTTASSFFLTFTFWSQISTMLAPVAIGLEVSKISLFMEIKNSRSVEKLLIISVSLFLSIASISTSKIQIETLVAKQNEIYQKESIAFRNDQEKRNKLMKSIELREQSIERDLKNNYRTRALESQKHMETMLGQLDVTHEMQGVQVLNLNETAYWLLAGILDIVIFSLFYLLGRQRQDSLPQKTIRTVKKTLDAPVSAKKSKRHDDVASIVKEAILKSGSTNAQNLRAMLGTSTHRVCQGLQALAKQGFIQKQGRSYQIVGI